MVGLMRCSLHVEGHLILLMNHEKGKHTLLCGVFNNQLVVIRTVHLPKVCSICKHRNCFINTSYSLMAQKPVYADSPPAAGLRLVALTHCLRLSRQYRLATLSPVQIRCDFFPMLQLLACNDLLELNISAIFFFK